MINSIMFGGFCYPEYFTLWHFEVVPSVALCYRQHQHHPFNFVVFQFRIQYISVSSLFFLLLLVSSNKMLYVCKYWQIWVYKYKVCSSRCCCCWWCCFCLFFAFAFACFHCIVLYIMLFLFCYFIFILPVYILTRGISIFGLFEVVAVLVTSSS